MTPGTDRSRRSRAKAPRNSPVPRDAEPVELPSNEYFFLWSGQHEPDAQEVAAPAPLIAPGSKGAWIAAACSVVAAVVFLVFLVFQRADVNQRLQSSEAMVEVLNQEIADLHDELRDKTETNAVIDKERGELLEEKQAHEDEVKEQTAIAEETAAAVQEAMAAEIEAGTFKLEQEGPRVVMTLAHHLAFDPGDVAPNAEGNEVLARLGRVMSRHAKHRIHIVGHTDSTRPKRSMRGAFPTNWALSVARAAAVAAAFEKRGVSGKRMVAAGQGEERPFASNRTSKGRAKNRRVEIILGPR